MTPHTTPAPRLAEEQAKFETSFGESFPDILEANGADVLFGMECGKYVNSLVLVGWTMWNRRAALVDAPQKAVQLQSPDTTLGPFGDQTICARALMADAIESDDGTFLRYSFTVDQLREFIKSFVRHRGLDAVERLVNKYAHFESDAMRSAFRNRLAEVLATPQAPDQAPQAVERLARFADAHCVGSNRSTGQADADGSWTFDVEGLWTMLAAAAKAPAVPRETLNRAADFLAQYAGYIREVKPDDLERHPYLPKLEEVAQELRLTAPAPAMRLTDERIDRVLGDAYLKLVKDTGYNGGMGGETWDRAAARAIEAELNGATAQKPDIAKIEQHCISYAALSCLGHVKQAYRLFHAQGKTEEDFDKCAWDAITKAVKHAVQLTAREVSDPVWPYAASPAAEQQRREPTVSTVLDVTLSDEAATLLRDHLVIEGEDDASPIRLLLLVGDGHSGYGLYVAAAEHQEQGAMLLAAIPDFARVERCAPSVAPAAPPAQVEVPVAGDGNA